jgi:acyl carrier protein
MRMTIHQRLAGVFEKAFGYQSNRFALDATPDDVPNWDSIGHMNLVSQLEQEFQVQFEVDEIMEMSSARRIAEILNTRGIAD